MAGVEFGMDDVALLHLAEQLVVGGDCPQGVPSLLQVCRLLVQDGKRPPEGAVRCDGTVSGCPTEVAYDLGFQACRWTGDIEQRGQALAVEGR